MKFDYLLVQLILLCLFISCKKTDKPVESVKKVYIAGTQEDNSGNAQPKYWLDSTMNSLNIPGNSEAYVLDMKMVDRNIYLLIEESRGQDDYCSVYKNGTRIYDFRTDSAYITAIAVSGNDVYMAGRFYLNSPPYYRASAWKNGVLIYRDNANLETYANEIDISGSNILISGRGSNISTGAIFGRYWLNGTATNLTDAYELYGGVISGNDIYTCGFTNTNYAPAYWKNGIKNQLQSAGLGGSAHQILVSGSDVYVVGNDIVNNDYQQMLWKNGQSLSLPSTFNAGGTAYGIALDGTDVYVAGQVNHNQGSSGGEVAVFWKNGVMKVLAPLSNWSQAVAVVVQ